MAIRLRDQVLMASVEDEAVLLQTDSEQYYSLNSTALRMLQVLTDEPTVGAACQKLLAEFDADAETLTRDLHQLIAQLQTRNLIEVDAD